MRDNVAALKRLRKAIGWTARDLADASGVSHHVIQNIESGRKSLSLDELVSLAVALDVHPAVIDARLDPSGVGQDARKYAQIVSVIEGTGR